ESAFGGQLDEGVMPGDGGLRFVAETQLAFRSAADLNCGPGMLKKASAPQFCRDFQSNVHVRTLMTKRCSPSWNSLFMSKTIFCTRIQVPFREPAFSNCQRPWASRTRRACRGLSIGSLPRTMLHWASLRPSQ